MKVTKAKFLSPPSRTTSILPNFHIADTITFSTMPAVRAQLFAARSARFHTLLRPGTVMFHAKILLMQSGTWHDCENLVNRRRLPSKFLLIQNVLYFRKYLTWHTSFRGRHVEVRRRGAPERKGQPRVQFVCFEAASVNLKVSSEGERCIPWRKSFVTFESNSVTS